MSMAGLLSGSAGSAAHLESSRDYDRQAVISLLSHSPRPEVVAKDVESLPKQEP